LKENQKVSDHLQKDSETGEPVAFRLGGLRWPFAQEEDSGEEYPTEHYPGQCRQGEWVGVRHGFARCHCESACKLIYQFLFSFLFPLESA
jgi:hypothetical protein